MNPKIRIKLAKLRVMIITWVLIGAIISIYDHLTLQSDYSAGFSTQYSFTLNLGFNVFAAFVGSVLGGIFLIFYMEERSRHMSYGGSMLLVSAIYVAIVVTITVGLGLIFVPLLTDTSIWTEEGQKAYLTYLINPIHVKNTMAWSIVVGLTQLAFQVDNKFGQGILLSFIKGKYKRPQLEKRIFMFIDLKSSTAIAEQLGNEQYHDLLREFFEDITNPILYNEGEIYQYVGDEVVVSWPFEHGIENNNCIRCYLKMREKISRKSVHYKARFGLVPEFKAGLHYGDVIAGEIGVIKRDITYSGDVLNTTARIQGMCNELGVEFLTSSDMVALLPASREFQFSSLGEIELRGKQSMVPVCTLNRG